MTEGYARDKNKKEKIKNTKIHNIIEGVSFLILLAMIIYPLVLWGNIPDKIPMHYNALGEINRWGNKWELIILPIVGAIMYLLMTVVSAFPSTWNIPVTITRENKERVYSSIKSLLVILKAEILAIFFYLEFSCIEAKPLSSDYLSIVLVTVFGTLAFFIVRMVKVSKRRPQI